ncbi:MULTISPECIES: glycosyltransferase family 1 protein [unclassified Pseudomonas]|uniref:glycosyltransferase family 4 protein n=1 Tax=unclassified Pseudomonas TaxID=196821 RepID=UPI000CD28D8B|nr:MULTISPECIES: glycosyltransferase family 1 protein [unclassified Pseudomonas]POA32052.1 glycosyltransferase family 1 protein [Pseudomonas sp. GW456-R21]POA67672.1 glycosyltransferase family 1 protein [Pseudomonas sp. GW460-R15]
MRIVIDMQGAQTESRFRGIGRYSLSLAQGIVRNRGENEVYLVLNGMLSESIDSIRTAFMGLLPQSHIRVWYAQGPVCDCSPGNSARKEMAQWIRQACIDDLKPDVVHVTSAVEGYMDDAVIGSPLLDTHALVSATLYDLIPLVSPKQYLDSNPGYKKHYLEKVDAFTNYGLLLSISDFAREEALSLLPLDSESVVNVSTAADDIFRPVTLSLDERHTLDKKFGLREKFVLYSGGADDRKNLPQLIKAFAVIKAELDDIQLVFAGNMSEYHVNNYQELALAQGLSRTDLVFTGYITDSELVALYNSCQVYVFPSWHEGFGLPPLEAMKCGVPVIGANRSSVLEVIGWEDATFDPFDIHAISGKLRQALTDDNFRLALATHGLQRAKQFSWDRTGKDAVAAFEQALAKFERPAKRTDTPQSSGDGTQTLINALAGTGHLHTGAVDIQRLAKAIDYSLQGPAGKPTLFVDISELCKHDGKSGIQRVVRSILAEWLNHPPEGYEIKPVYTKVGEPFYRYATHFTTMFRGKDASEADQDEAISYRAGDVYLCLDLLMDVLPHKQTYLDTMRSHGVSIFFVVYDLLILQLPHCFVESLQAHYVKWIHAVAQYDGAMCISHAVADELREWLDKNVPPRKRPFCIGAFHLGADIDQSMPSTGFPENPALRIESLEAFPNFLMVGTLEPRKGHAQTLDAFELLWAAGVQANLIIVGKHGWLVDELAARLASHPELGKRLLWLEGASDEYLEYLYNHCDCLIAASYGEGFGLPLIEAAQYKLPIIARDLPVFREVAGEFAWYFNGTTAQDIAESLTEWLKLYEYKQHPQSGGMPWLTWKGSAQQLIGEIDKCAF